jgi:hypothetical protein
MLYSAQFMFPIFRSRSRRVIPSYMLLVLLCAVAAGPGSPPPPQPYAPPPPPSQQQMQQQQQQQHAGWQVQYPGYPTGAQQMQQQQQVYGQQQAPFRGAPPGYVTAMPPRRSSDTISEPQQQFGYRSAQQPMQIPFGDGSRQQPPAYPGKS